MGSFLLGGSDGGGGLDMKEEYLENHFMGKYILKHVLLSRCESQSLLHGRATLDWLLKGKRLACIMNDK